MLLLLLVLSSSLRLLDAVENRSPDQKDTSMIPSLEDKQPKFTANVSTTRRILPPSHSRPRRHYDPFNLGGNLHWRQWIGFLPIDAVFISNKHVDRRDYICKVGCNSGFYSPNKGPFCYYPDKGKEIRGSMFEILVNEFSLEILEWKEGYRGSLPENSVRTCSSDYVYVGKNMYGLGMVIPKDRCIYIPLDGSEIWYWSYEVLTTTVDIREETISRLEYNASQAKVIKINPTTLKTSTIKNADCRTLKKTATVSTSITETKTWDINDSVLASAKQTFKAGVPSVVEGRVEVAAEMSFDYTKGGSITEVSTHTMSFELEVPPNHSCTVRLVGSTYNTKIAFIALLTRTYGNRENRWATITGTYHEFKTSEVRSEFDRCQPIPNANPCPEQA